MTKCIDFLSNLKIKMRFRKGFNTHQCLIYIIEKWGKYLNTGGHGTALLAYLSKAFNYVDHQLLTIKVNAYDGDKYHLYF